MAIRYGVSLRRLDSALFLPVSNGRYPDTLDMIGLLHFDATTPAR
jgi:hypothetical protein